MTFWRRSRLDGENSQGLRKALAVSMVVVSTLLVFVAGSLTTEVTSESDVIVTAEAGYVVARISDSDNVVALAKRQRELAEDSRNTFLAISVGSSALEIFQATGNERYVGMARDALEPWWSLDSPPAEIWLLRSRILQNRHHFTEAARDLASYSKSHPGSNEASLLEADAWRRAGELKYARQACVRVALSGEHLLARYCAAELLLTAGQHQPALDSLTAASDRQQQLSGLSDSLQHWAEAIEADILIANDRHADAMQVWQEIGITKNLSVPEKLTYADLLLQQGQFHKVLEMMQDLPVSSAVLLRRAFAMKALGHQEYSRTQDTLQQLLQQPVSHAEAGVHLREQALSALWLENDSARATALAMENWHQQKGWEDAELVLAAGRAVQEQGDSGNGHAIAVTQEDLAQARFAIATITHWRESWSKELGL
jgi:hypothetical protein